MQQLPTGQFTTHSAEETFELAYSIGETITEASVFLLQGDLGAGKTVFAKGIAAGLNIDPAEVNSPTFTLVNQHEGRMRMYHLDLYRIEGGADEMYAIGLEDMLNDPDSVIVVEWPERLGTFAIPDAYRAMISYLEEERRKISIERIMKSEALEDKSLC